MFMAQSNTFTRFWFPRLSGNNRTNTSPNPAVLMTLMSHNPYGCHDEFLRLFQRVSNGQRRRPRGTRSDPRSPTTAHGAGTHSIEGTKWQENAEHIAQDIWGCSAFMLSKWDSYCRVHLGSPSQNFFRAPPARSAGKPMEHSYQYRLRFGTRSGCQNFRASFRGISKTSRRFSIGFLYDELHRSWFPNPTPQQRNTQKDKHDRSLTLEM